jgi:hypothetical protein
MTATVTQSPSRSRTGIPAIALLVIVLVAALATAWAVVSARSGTTPASTSISTGTASTAQVGVPLEHAPAFVRTGAGAELHQYGAAPTSQLGTVGVVTTSNSFSHPTGDTAEQFRNPRR